MAMSASPVLSDAIKATDSNRPPSLEICSDSTTEAEADSNADVFEGLRQFRDLHPYILSYLPSLYFPTFQRLMRSVAFNDVLGQIEELTCNKNRDSLVSYVWRVSQDEFTELLRSDDVPLLAFQTFYSIDLFPSVSNMCLRVHLRKCAG